MIPISSIALMKMESFKTKTIAMRPKAGHQLALHRQVLQFTFTIGIMAVTAALNRQEPELRVVRIHPRQASLILPLAFLEVDSVALVKASVALMVEQANETH